MDKLYEVIFQLVIIFSFLTIGIAALTAIDVGPAYIKDKISSFLRKRKYKKLERKTRSTLRGQRYHTF